MIIIWQVCCHLWQGCRSLRDRGARRLELYRDIIVTSWHYRDIHPVSGAGGLRACHPEASSAQSPPLSRSPSLIRDDVLVVGDREGLRPRSFIRSLGKHNALPSDSAQSYSLIHWLDNRKFVLPQAWLCKASPSGLETISTIRYL